MRRPRRRALPALVSVATRLKRKMRAWVLIYHVVDWEMCRLMVLCRGFIHSNKTGSCESAGFLCVCGGGWAMLGAIDVKEAYIFVWLSGSWHSNTI